VQKIKNQLRVDKGTESLKVGIFLRHGVVIGAQAGVSCRPPM